jgi:hypothetical protein
MGTLQQLRPTLRGQCFRGHQLGRLDNPRIHPPSMFCCEKVFAMLVGEGTHVLHDVGILGTFARCFWILLLQLLMLHSVCMIETFLYVVCNM